MIDRKDFREHPEKYQAALQRRGSRFAHLLKTFGALHDQVDTGKQRELEELQAEMNAANRLIPSLPPADKKKKIAAMKKVSDRIAAMKAKMKSSDRDPELELPNIPKDDVPDGRDDRENVVIREVGKKPALKNPKDYLTLAKDLGVIDMERGSKVSGSRFGYILGPLAQMEFALVQYAQQVLLPEGFTMVVPPVLIKAENMAAMGYLAGGGESETYHLPDDDLYLVGTSEQSVGPMHRDEIFREQDLPKRYLAFSTCFRREAGSYGQDTKGIMRVHQFDKLEMFSLTLPEQSDAEHEFLLGLEERLMQGLGLAYRVVKICAGDLGYPSARTYDVETWMPGQDQYRETHSASTTTDYQSRDLHIRVRRRDGRVELVHMLNATAFSMSRPLIAILENYQQPDGSVAVPKALQPFMNGLQVIRRP